MRRRFNRTGYRDMHAKFPGRCACGAEVKPGAPITYNYDRREIAFCAACHPDRSVAPTARVYDWHKHPDPTDTAYEDACAAACGLDGHDRQN